MLFAVVAVRPTVSEIVRVVDVPAVVDTVENMAVRPTVSVIVRVVDLLFAVVAVRPTVSEIVLVC